MPRFDTDMETHQIGGSNFAFTATSIAKLGATEYTLAVLAVDVSGSTSGFRRQMEEAIAQVVKACRQSPRADNMMLRVLLFDTQVRELHGFKPLPDCNEADYKDCCSPGGMTALHDATWSAVHSAIAYGKQLVAQDFSCNAALFVVTDGEDNASKVSAQMVAQALTEARTSEALESIMPVLIGVGNDTSLNKYLTDFKTNAGFQQHVMVGAATEKSLAKLANFIAASVSSQSKSLGTGGPSQSLAF